MIEPQHLLLSMLGSDSAIRPVIEQAGGNASQLAAKLAEAVEHLPTVQGAAGEVHVSQTLAKLLNVTDQLAQQRGDSYISTELFVLACFEDPNPQT